MRITILLCFIAACAGPEGPAALPKIPMEVLPMDPPEPVYRLPDALRQGERTPGWTWERPLPTRRAMFRLRRFSPDNAWAVGQDGSIMHWDGVRWHLIDSGTTTDLWDVWADAPNNVWAVGKYGTVLRFDGARFRRLPPETTWNLAMVAGDGPNNIMVMSETVPVRGPPPPPGSSHVYYVFTRQLLRFDGTKWTVTTFSLGTSDHPVHLHTLVKLGGRTDDYWAFGSHVLSFDGKSWRGEAGSFGQRNPVEEFGTPWISGTELWLAQNSLYYESWAPTGLYRCQTDKGCTRLESEPKVRYAILGGTGPNDVWASVSPYARPMEYRRWNGTTLEKLPGTTPLPDHLRWPVYPLRGMLETEIYALAGGGPDDLWAAGRQMFRRSGEAWTEVPMPGSEEIHALWGSLATGLWAVGERGAAYLNQGTGWRSVRTGTDVKLGALGGSAPDDVWALGRNVLLHWDGTAWRPQALPAEARDPAQLAVASRRHVALGCGKAGFFHLEGTGWTRSQLPDGEVATGLWAAGGELWALGGRGRIFRWTGRWEQWLHIPLAPARLGPAHVRGPDDIWVARSDRNDDLLHWDGRRWRRVRLDCKAGIDGFFSAGHHLWTWTYSAGIAHYEYP